MKKLLYVLLSERNYLLTLHRFFYLFYNMGLLRNKEAFKFHYFVQKVIRPDYVVIDIGANLGYFAKTFSKLAAKGKVIAIEPLPQFYEILDHFIGHQENVELHNVALGQHTGVIRMVLPSTNGMIRTGLPHVLRPGEEQTQEKIQDVQMVNTSDFFETFERIDYIKCDIEGHEWEVFQQLPKIIGKHRPIIQLEIDPKNENKLFDFFEQLDYQRYGLDGQICRKEQNQHFGGDYLFIPAEKENLVAQWNA
ncbi:MAG: FkbM family methyltransferase [Flavobacteriales bacterium]